MSDRIAPDGGYDFPAKKLYRRQVWNHFRNWTGSRTSEAMSLLMPSSEGDEIDVALSKGYRQDKMVIFDKNKAIVAILKRKYKSVTAKGCLANEIGDKLKAGGLGPFHVINFDLTGTVTSVAPTLRRFADSGVLAPAAMVAVTVQKGREQRVAYEHVTRLSSTMRRVSNTFVNGLDNLAKITRETGGGSLRTLSREAAKEAASAFSDDIVSGRLATLGNALCGEPSIKTGHWSDEFYLPRLAMLSRYGEYQSDSPMLWAIFKVHKQPCLCETCMSNHIRYAASDKAAYLVELYCKAVGLSDVRARRALMYTRCQNIGFGPLRF